MKFGERRKPLHFNMEEPREDLSLRLSEERDSDVEEMFEEDEKFRCFTCGQFFDEKEDLVNHVNSKHKGKKPYPCPKCSMSFTTNTKLSTHLARIHEGKKTFECPTCGKMFKRNSHLNIRNTAVHNQGRYKCTHCPKTFFQKI